MPKTHEGHTTERIYSEVCDTLCERLGNGWKEKLGCSVTDGAENVSAASQRLGTSRR